ncbi:hypothetical protein ABIE48_003157 [Paenibacillus sp. OAE614]
MLYHFSVDDSIKVFVPKEKTKSPRFSYSSIGI